MRGRNLLLFMALAVSICILFSTARAARKIVDADDFVDSVEHSKAVPGQLNYQAYLVDAAGDSAVNAALEMTFALYDAETKGSELWSEIHAAVEVSNGWFHVLLGSVTPFPGGLFDGSPLWLQTTVGTETLEPRKSLVSVAYSQRAGDADHAAQADIADDAGQLEGQTLVDLDDRWVKVADLDHLDAADGDPGSAVYVDSAGKVGIGTTSPLIELDVNGSVKAATYYGDGSNLTGISGTADGDWIVSGSHIYSAVPGSVGIGTLTPAAKLDVQGTLNVGQDSTGYDVNFYGADGGSRFFWDQEKMALRAGIDPYGTNWAPDSIGSFSFAMGHETRASGDYSVAMGRNTRAQGDYSVALVSGGATAGGVSSIAMGHYARAFGDHSAAIGNQTKASGENAIAMGYHAEANGYGSVAIGEDLTADSSNTIVLGSGIPKNPLVNDIENSLMVGFNDTTATLFVGGPDDRVGIGTVAPMHALDVNGDVKATAFIGDGSQLTNISGTVDSDWNVTNGDMHSIPSGNVGIGTASPQAKLHVEGNALVSDTLSAGTSTNHGYFHLYGDGISAPIVTLESDQDAGGGGVLRVKRASGAPAFTVDGNYGGTNSAYVSISGMMGSVRFDMSTSGDGSVYLPSDVISSHERLDEPGVASATGGYVQIYNLDAKVLQRRSINCPSNGYVLVIATSDVIINNLYDGPDLEVKFGISHNDSTFPADQTSFLKIPSRDLPSGDYRMPVTVHGLFEVTSGSHTFSYFTQQYSLSPNNLTFYDNHLILLFCPTAYGTVEPIKAGESNPPYEEIRETAAFSEEALATKRVESTVFNSSGIQSELAAVRARLDALEREMERRQK